MRRVAGTAAGVATRPPSILDFDQLNQLVSRNRVFLRDFLLVICALVVFVLLIVFILLIYNVQKNLELASLQRQLTRQRYLENLDYRARPRTNPTTRV